MLKRMQRKGNLPTLLVGMLLWKQYGDSLKTENSVTI